MTKVGWPWETTPRRRTCTNHTSIDYLVFCFTSTNTKLHPPYPSATLPHLNMCACVPHGDSWTPSWRRLRSETLSVPSCWLTRSQSWWRRGSPVRLWPRPSPSPRTPCRTTPGRAHDSSLFSPVQPPTHLVRTLHRKKKTRSGLKLVRP